MYVKWCEGCSKSGASAESVFGHKSDKRKCHSHCGCAESCNSQRDVHIVIYFQSPSLLPMLPRAKASNPLYVISRSKQEIKISQFRQRSCNFTFANWMPPAASQFSRNFAQHWVRAQREARSQHFRLAAPVSKLAPASPCVCVYFGVNKSLTPIRWLTCLVRSSDESEIFHVESSIMWPFECVRDAHGKCARARKFFSAGCANCVQLQRLIHSQCQCHRDERQSRATSLPPDISSLSLICIQT